MKIVYTVVADCDPPPDSYYDPRADADLLDDLEDAVANALIGVGAGFAIDATVAVEI